MSFKELMLLDELIKGSPQAFRMLVDKYSRQVVGTCFSFVHNQEDAEDIAQEVFLEVFKSIRQFREEADLNTWVYRISISKSIDFQRKQNRKKRIKDFAGLIFHRKQAETPSEQLEDEERAEILKQQIAYLAENQRIALVLSQYDRLSVKEIAEIMQTSESSVESLLHRAKTNLRKKLENYFEKKF
jgi:RNA polymerase sigma-70 factor, ECF subfamily